MWHPIASTQQKGKHAFDRAHVRSASTSCSTRRRRAFSRACHAFSWRRVHLRGCQSRARLPVSAHVHIHHAHTSHYLPMSTPTRLRSRGAVSRPPRSQKTTYNTTRADATYSKCNVPPQPQRCQSPVAALPASTAAIGLRRSSLRSARRSARRPQRQPLALRRMRCIRAPALRD